MHVHYILCGHTIGLHDKFYMQPSHEMYRMSKDFMAAKLRTTLSIKRCSSLL